MTMTRQFNRVSSSRLSLVLTPVNLMSGFSIGAGLAAVDMGARLARTFCWTRRHFVAPIRFKAANIFQFFQEFFLSPYTSKSKAVEVKQNCMDRAALWLRAVKANKKEHLKRKKMRVFQLRNKELYSMKTCLRPVKQEKHRL